MLLCFLVALELSRMTLNIFQVISKIHAFTRESQTALNIWIIQPTSLHLIPCLPYYSRYNQENGKHYKIFKMQEIQCRELVAQLLELLKTQVGIRRQTNRLATSGLERQKEEGDFWSLGDRALNGSWYQAGDSAITKEAT